MAATIGLAQVAHDLPCGVPGVVRHQDEMIER
jgi:hypothetical protein